MGLDDPNGTPGPINSTDAEVLVIGRVARVDRDAAARCGGMDGQRQENEDDDWSMHFRARRIGLHRFVTCKKLNKLVKLSKQQEQ